MRGRVERGGACGRSALLAPVMPGGYAGAIRPGVEYGSNGRADAAGRGMREGRVASSRTRVRKLRRRAMRGRAIRGLAVCRWKPRSLPVGGCISAAGGEDPAFWPIHDGPAAQANGASARTRAYFRRGHALPLRPCTAPGWSGDVSARAARVLSLGAPERPGSREGAGSGLSVMTRTCATESSSTSSRRGYLCGQLRPHTRVPFERPWRSRRGSRSG